MLALTQFSFASLQPSPGARKYATKTISSALIKATIQSELLDWWSKWAGERKLFAFPLIYITHTDTHTYLCVCMCFFLFLSRQATNKSSHANCSRSHVVWPKRKCLRKLLQIFCLLSETQFSQLERPKTALSNALQAFVRLNQSRALHARPIERLRLRLGLAAPSSFFRILWQFCILHKRLEMPLSF